MQTVVKFDQFPLDTKIINSLKSLNIEKASEIQALTIEPIIEQKDIFALAKTGSGKTLAFIIPLFQKMINSQSRQTRDELGTQVIVLSPTRELAQQTHQVMISFGKQLGFNSACLIGGESIEKQIKQLETDSQILVATPGRMVDLIKQKKVDLKNCHAAVFDEVDRIFDMGFEKDIDFILSKCPSSRQIIMLSATSNQNVLRTAYRHHSNPIELKVETEDMIVQSIDHKVAMISAKEKMPFLFNLLKNHDETYAIIFCNTQFQTHLVASWLQAGGYKASPISGRLSQSKRTKLMQDFRDKEITILVCTDVAARGLDIDDVNLVINYDLPAEAASYVHRIGRTGRAGKSGQAISFCAFEDCENLDSINELIGESITKMEVLDEDFASKIPPKPYIDAKTLTPTERSNSFKNNSSYSREPRGTKNKRTSNNDHFSKRDNMNKSNDNKNQKNDSRSHQAKKTEKTFEHTSFSFNTANNAACDFFKVKSSDLLTHTILSEGRRKFFFFGPKETTYKFFLRPNFKKILLPFIIELLKKSDLNLYAKLFYRGLNIQVDFSGKDSELLFKNRSELLYSLEQLIKVFLQRLLPGNRDLKVRVNSRRDGRQDNRHENRSERGSRHRSNSRGNHEQNEQKLMAKVQELKDKVLKEKETVTFGPLNPRERRSVHQFLSDEDSLETKSLGEGRMKKMQIHYISQ